MKEIDDDNGKEPTSPPELPNSSAKEATTELEPTVIEGEPVPKEESLEHPAAPNQAEASDYGAENLPNEDNPAGAACQEIDNDASSPDLKPTGESPEKPVSEMSNAEKGDLGECLTAEAIGDNCEADLKHQTDLETSDKNHLEQPLRAESAGDAQEHPGKFYVETNEDGCTASIEGWIKLQDSERSHLDSTLQKESKSSLLDATGKDGGHLIAHSLGGPSVESHGSDLTRENLIPMDARINRSYVSDVENSLRSELEAGRELYVRVEVSYSEGANGQLCPDAVTHSWMEKDSSGELKPCSISHRGEQVSSVETQARTEGEKPAQTVATAYRNAENQPWKDNVH